MNQVSELRSGVMGNGRAARMSVLVVVVRVDTERKINSSGSRGYSQLDLYTFTFKK